MNVESAPPSRTVLLIDGYNFHRVAKALGFDVDYRRLLAEFNKCHTVVRALYYTTLIIDDHELSSIRPLVDWLAYNGYTVVTKALKEYVDTSGRRKMKGGMGIEMVVDAMELAKYVDEIVLFSGDGEFRALVAAVQRRGVRVSVVSTISTVPPMVADELRRQADRFVDLLDLKASIERRV